MLEDGGEPPIGLFSHLQYKRETRAVQAGSVVVIYTDGVSEAENIMGEQFGLERLSSIVVDERAASASRIHAEIRSALRQFVGNAPTHDDRALIVLKFD